jgi:Tfp pilus assembly protein PilO
MNARLVPLIGVLVALLVAAGFYFLLYQPRQEEQEQLEAETAQLIGQQSQLQAQIDELTAIRDDQPRIAAALERLELLIPSTVAQAAAIRQLQSAADAAGVDLSSITFADPVAVTPAATTADGLQLGSVTTSAVVEGGYFQAVDFFRRLETDVDRAVLVSSVTMAEGPDGFPSLSTTWTGELFALIPAVATVNPASPPPVPGATPSPTASPAAGATAAPASPAPTQSPAAG